MARIRWMVLDNFSNMPSRRWFLILFVGFFVELLDKRSCIDVPIKKKKKKRSCIDVVSFEPLRTQEIVCPVQTRKRTLFASCWYEKISYCRQTRGSINKESA